MAEEAYFRIPKNLSRDSEELERSLKKVALLFQGGGSLVSPDGIAHEGAGNDQMKVGGYGSLYSRTSGYKYQVGTSNDLKMDEVLSEHNIYLLAYRYGDKEQMRQISRGICQILRLDYIYTLAFEAKVREHIFPLIMSSMESTGRTVYLAQDELYEESRSLIQSALVSERIFESELADNKIQDIIIQAMIKHLVK